MAKRRLGPNDVDVGKPLPFELLDASGRILLNAGYVIPDESQLERLIDREVFFESIEDDHPQSSCHERISAYDLLTEIQRKYEALLSSPIDARVLGDMGNVARDLHRLTALDPDITLATAQIYRFPRYAIRHGFATAAITAVLMRGGGLQ